MPGILGLNGNGAISNRKLSSKITFKEGEKFTGKIVKKEGEKNVVIKLANGWKVEAEVDEGVDLEENGTFKFVVKDAESGKLKLKLVKDSSGGVKKLITDELILKFIKEKGISKEEAVLMKEMVQREISLTKENINKFKEVLFFLENIKNNSEEENKFISKFLDSKFIQMDKSSAEVILKDFFNTFKGMSKEEVLVFLENNIELTKENIEGYNKLFKEDKLNEFIKDVKILVNKECSVVGEKENLKKDKANIEVEKSEIRNKELIKGNNISYGKTEEKASVIGLIKSIVGENNKGIKETIKDIIVDKNIISSAEIKEIEEKLEGITEGKFIRVLQENINLKSEGQNTTTKLDDFLRILESMNKEEEVLENVLDIDVKVKEKENVSEVITKILGKDIKLDTEDYKKILDVIETFEKEKLTSEVRDKILDKPKNLEISDIKKEGIIKELKDKIMETKEVTQKLEESLLAKTSEKLIAFVKNNIGEFKIFNAISNEYYYLDMPINVERENYPCKLIIKDDRKDGKIIDKNNVKVIVNLKTINLGSVDAYIHLNHNNITVTLKCSKEGMGIIKEKSDTLKKSLEVMNLNVKVGVEEKVDEVTLANCREFFKRKENKILDRTV